ncbi:MAG: J domain-containing protein [Bdellovibrio sp.]|nr:J domain-containing protein [Bdellovibrio sp.]
MERVFYISQIVIFGLFIAVLIFFRPGFGRTKFKQKESNTKTQPERKCIKKLLTSKNKPAEKHKPEPPIGIDIHGKPHEILGVSENATKNEITKAYHDKIKQYHPDKAASQDALQWSQKTIHDTQKIAEAINAAKDTLIKSLKS